MSIRASIKFLALNFCITYLLNWLCPKNAILVTRSNNLKSREFQTALKVSLHKQAFSYAFYGGNVVRVLVHFFFFTAAHFYLA